MVRIKETTQRIEATIKPWKDLKTTLIVVGLFFFSLLCIALAIYILIDFFPDFSKRRRISYAFWFLVLVCSPYIFLFPVGVWNTLNSYWLGKGVLTIDLSNRKIIYTFHRVFMKSNTWESSFNKLEVIFINEAQHYEKLEALNTLDNETIAFLIDHKKVLSAQLLLSQKDINQLLDLNQRFIRY